MRTGRGDLYQGGYYWGCLRCPY
jgi:hypothetical protein